MVSDFRANLSSHFYSFPQMAASVGESIALVFRRPDTGGTLSFLLLFAVTIGIGVIAEVLINPFKSQGAADVTDIGIVIRGKFSTVPGGQFVIRKEVRVHLPEHLQVDDLTVEQKEAISAAASEESEAPGR